jgi:hypothetical protein
MAIAAGDSNLFFNRDTKVFVGADAGIRLITTAGAANVLTTRAHGMSSGDVVVITTMGGLTGPTADIFYYVNVPSATTFSLHTTLALALAGTSPVTLGGTYLTTILTAYGKSETATGIATSGSSTTVTITTTHKFAQNDLVEIYNITDSTYAYLNGVYNVDAIGTTATFNITLDSAVTVTTGAWAATAKIRRLHMWEMPVLSGYSASQSMSTSDITLNEMASSTGTSRRGRQVFNDALSPTEWSFDTYIRPFKSTNHYCVEEPMMAFLLANNHAHIATPSVTPVTVWRAGVTRDSTDLDFDFNSSNTVTLGTFTLYFIAGANKVSGRSYASRADGGSTSIYRVADAVINEMGITFDIDGISMVSWSGMGSNLTEMGAFYGTGASSFGISSTSNFIRNRLTALSLVSASSMTPASNTYAITLTGGSITISNNISYLTPETLGVVNKPIGHVTGTRTISGTLTAYLDEVTSGTADLFQHLAEFNNTAVQNRFTTGIFIGGGSGSAPTAPGVLISMPYVHLEVPSIGFDDVLSTEVNFHALSDTVAGTNEISGIKYIGQNL